VASRRFTRFEPSMAPAEREARFAAWERAVNAALVWARHR
jgi:glycerol kinase